MSMKRHACRVCGCTEDRACPGGCSWVRVERGGETPNDPPVPLLCSACSGSEADMLEALGRITTIPKRGGGHEKVQEAARIARAAIRRHSEAHRTWLR